MKFVILISVLIKVCLSKTSGSVVKSTSVAVTTEAVTTEAVTTAEVTIGSTDASVTSGKPMIEECPYIASIELNNQHNCGGVIIVKNKILTSAHCCNFNTTELKVRVGSEIKGQDGTVLEVEKIRSHEKFNKTSLDYDVCVLTLKADIPIDDKNMKIAKLNDKAIDGGEKVVEYGYGHLNSTHTSNYLLKYETTTISNKDCMEQMIHPSTKETLITENMMCINLVDGKGTWT